MTTQVKICGITNLSDAIAAIKAGADMLGYNFYEGSPRYISPTRCLEIQDGIKRLDMEITTVGVFVNEETNKIKEILDECGVDYAQLSGDESPSAIADLGASGFKAIQPQTISEADNLAVKFANKSIKPALLLDAFHPTQYGGTGRKTNLSLAQHLANTYSILLAGGLNPDNVAGAVANATPWGVDVASGVEARPGIKDHNKIIAFIRTAKSLT